MPKPISKPLIFALLAALSALLFAWFAPLPRLVLGDEEKAGERMPENRAAAEAARFEFVQAQKEYKAYVSTHDVGAALNQLESTIAATKMMNSGTGLLIQATIPVREYLDQLRAYAQAGERYFAALRHYDDELMTLTRSLGTAGEALRRATWPIVDHLRIYPTPDGEVMGYPIITASDVTSYTNAISSHAPTLEAVDNVRAAGRTIEYRNGWHLEYGRILGVYDTKAAAIASNSSGSGLSSNRALFALGLNVLLGAVTLAGLAALFLQNRAGKREAQL